MVMAYLYMIYHELPPYALVICSKCFITAILPRVSSKPDWYTPNYLMPTPTCIPL